MIRLPKHLGVHPGSPTAELIRVIDTITTLAHFARLTGRPMVTETDRARSVEARARWGR